MIFKFGDRGCSSMGRNGLINTHGIEVLTRMYTTKKLESVEFSPVTSRDNVANCSIEIPVETMDELCAWWIAGREKGEL